jgi:hypothetical protein
MTINNQRKNTQNGNIKMMLSYKAYLVMSWNRNCHRYRKPSKCTSTEHVVKNWEEVVL